MLLRLSLVASLVACAAALHEHGATPLREGDGCVAPGTCVPPAGAKYSRVIVGPKPGQQWNENGGFCGAWSVQQCALAHGAWISQDLVRKANAASPPPHTMHGDADEGYEVMPSNVAFTARALKLAYDEWDYIQSLSGECAIVMRSTVGEHSYVIHTGYFGRVAGSHSRL